MHAWDVTSPADDHAREPRSRCFDAADEIDVLLIGLGKDIAGLDPAIRAALRERQDHRRGDRHRRRRAHLQHAARRAARRRRGADRRRQRRADAARARVTPPSFLRAHDRDRYFATLVLQARAPRRRPGALRLQRRRRRDPRPRSRAGAGRDPPAMVDRCARAARGMARSAQNPLADALLDAIAGYSLPAGPLLRLIAARRFDLYDDPMPDLPTFEGYAGETVSVLYQLAAMILNGGDRGRNRRRRRPSRRRARADRAPPRLRLQRQPGPASSCR